MHRVGHELAAIFSMDLREKTLEVKHRFAGHLVRLQQSSLPLKVLSLRDLAWWRLQQKDYAKLKDKWHGSSPSEILAVGDGSQFSKSFADKQPDQRTVSPPILVGSGLRKTVLHGLLPGLRLLRGHSREDRGFPV